MLNENLESPAISEEGPESVRILVPSPVGNLGIEFVSESVRELIIVPKGAKRRKFFAYGEMKPRERTEFLEEALGRLSEYFAGARRRLEFDYDLGAIGVTGFTRRVLKETAKVPYGKTRTYRDIALAAGQPTAYRQVLSILQTNPLPIVIPCHRIVPSKTGAGSYIAGTKKKALLLRLEKKYAPMLQGGG